MTICLFGNHEGDWIFTNNISKPDFLNKCITVFAYFHFSGLRVPNFPMIISMLLTIMILYFAIVYEGLYLIETFYCVVKRVMRLRGEGEQYLYASKIEYL